MKRFILLTILFLFASNAVFTQVRPVEPEKAQAQKEEKKAEEKTPEREISSEKSPILETISDEELAKLPSTVKAKYEGGLFGYNKTLSGSLKFDDINERLVFLGEDGNEKFSLPYSVLIAVQPSEKKVQSTAGKMIGAAPILGAGIIGSLIKTKKYYVIVQFNDPEMNSNGIMNFLVSSGDLARTAIEGIGKRTGMKIRGDAYIRTKPY